MAPLVNFNGLLEFKLTAASPSLPVSLSSSHHPLMTRNLQGKGPPSVLTKSTTDAMTMSQYLGRGQLSRGRTTISKTLDMVVSTPPFFNDEAGGDKEALIKGIENM